MDGVRPCLAPLIVVLACACAAPARAETPTITDQAKANNARFLAFAPPPDNPGAVCLVDTGVDLNPDTASNVVERIALDGGDPGDGAPNRHGTAMASTIAAPVNDWGTVGVAPFLRIVSVRAAPVGSDSFPFVRYRQALGVCRDRSRTLPISAVNLSIGGQGATAEENAELRDEFLSTRANNISVVAGSGNDGAGVNYPGAIPEALTAGASDLAGSLCSFSSRGPGLDLLVGPCDFDSAYSTGAPTLRSGTSFSAAFLAGVLAALRSYLPGLSPAAAEGILLRTARAGPTGPRLDAEAAFTAAGLKTIVDAGNAAAPPDDEKALGGRIGPDHTARRRLPRPRVRRVRYRRGRLEVTLANRPPGALVVADAAYLVPRGVFRRRSLHMEKVASVMRVRVPRAWRSVVLQYRYFDLPPSKTVSLRPERTKDPALALVHAERYLRVHGAGS